MVVSTKSEQVLRARASALEFQLINHPLDCSVCDKAGECLLQNYAYGHGKYPDRPSIDSRMELDKIVPTTKELSSKIWIWANRCIQCSRCIRFAQEISGGGELTFVNRGAKSEIDYHPDRPIENNLSLNVVDLCPVGALLDKDFLYKSRVWFLDKRDSICPHCSKGCNISIQSFRNEVKRIKPRHNPEVNNFWICDPGRRNRDYFGIERVKRPELRVDGNLEARDRPEALKGIAEELQSLPAAKIAGLGSAQATCEDNYALRLLIEQLGGPVFAVRETVVGEADEFKKFRIEAEKAPNMKGALATLGVQFAGTKALCDKIESGKVAAVIALGNEIQHPLSDKEKEAFSRLDYLLVLDSWRSPLAELAHALLPAAVYSEKEGTFVNSGGRVQRLCQCLVPEESEAASEWVWLRRISDELKGSWEFGSPSRLFDLITRRIDAFSGISYKDLGEYGAKCKA
jgi:NADH-quinone oxidoreductase subunit G